MHSAFAAGFVRFGPKATKLLRCRDCPLCATNGLVHRRKKKDRLAAVSPKFDQPFD
jgi:hypothetical protein